MPRARQEKPLTPLELDIMQVLWRLRSATVQQVLDNLGARHRLAYTTVQTMLTILLRKRKVTRTLKGKAYEYAPAVSQQKATRTAALDLLHRFFGGSAETLVMALVDERELTPEKLIELARLVDAAENKKE